MRGKDRSLVSVFCALAMMIAGDAIAQADGAASTPVVETPSLDAEEVSSWSPPEYTLQIEALLWRPALQGDVSLPGSGSKVDVEDLNIDEPQLAPLVEVTYKRDAWQVRASGFGFSNDTGHHARKDLTLGDLDISEGERVKTDFDLFSAQIVVAKRVWMRTFDAPKKESGVAVSLDLGLGARLFDLDLKSEIVGGASESADNIFIQPMVGSKLVIDIYEEFTIDVDLNFGYMAYDDSSSLAFDIMVGAQWRPSPNVGVEFGYRFLYMGLEDGDRPDALDFDGALAGLYAGVVIRF